MAVVESGDAVLTEFDKTVTKSVQMIIFGQKGRVVNEFQLSSANVTKADSYEVKFQFPPKIVSDSKTSNWKPIFRESTWD